MTLLALTLAVTTLTSGVPEPARFDVDLSLAAGLGVTPSVGGVAQFTARREVWDTGGVSGGVAVGLWLGYQAEPNAFVSQFFPGLSGATHRFEALAIAGHDFRFFASRRLLVGVQLFAGWVQVAVRGALSNPELGVSRSHSANGGAFSTGVILRAGVRLTDSLSVVARGVAPFPYATAVNPYVLFTLGLSMEL